MSLFEWDLWTEQYHITRYNRRKRPWRSRRSIRKAMGRKMYTLRVCLCCAVFAEIAIIGVKEPAAFRDMGRLLISGYERSQTEEASGVENTYPPDKRDSGITIDLKEGKVKFWRTDQTVRPSGR